MDHSAAWTERFSRWLEVNDRIWGGGGGAVEWEDGRGSGVKWAAANRRTMSAMNTIAAARTVEEGSPGSKTGR